MATNLEWSIGFARQADADFGLFQTLMSLSDFEPPISVLECHKLQYLQMACEKLAKSHLCGEGAIPTTLQSSHAYIARTLPIILRETAQRQRFTGKHAREVMRQVRHLAREIELLAPAVKRGGVRPDNCEYPWEDANGELHLPIDWSFTPSQLLSLPAGRTILKLIRIAINNLLG